MADVVQPNHKYCLKHCVNVCANFFLHSIIEEIAKISFSVPLLQDIVSCDT